MGRAEELNMKRLRLLAMITILLSSAVSGAALGRQQERVMNDRERFVGAWRLAWMEEPGPDGRMIRRTDRKGSLLYTRDGRMAVQIQFPESQSSISNDYVLNGYEASFASYEVDEAAKTTTRHVEGSITRRLVGQSLTRAYRFEDGRLVMRSVRPEERWSVTWERY